MIVLFSIIAFIFFYVVIQILFQQVLLKHRQYLSLRVGRYTEEDTVTFSWLWVLFIPITIVLLISHDFYGRLKRYVLKGKG